MASIPSLDFNAGLGAMPQGGGATGQFLAGAQGFMQGMEQVRERQNQEIKLEREKRQFQQQEMLNQMRIKELDMRIEQFRSEAGDRELKRKRELEDYDWQREVRGQTREGWERQADAESFAGEQRERTRKQWEESDVEKDLAKQGQQIMAKGRAGIYGSEPSDVESIRGYIDGTYNALLEIGLGDQANQWMATYKSGDEESLRMLDVQNRQAEAAMQSEMQAVSRAATKLLENGNNFLSLTEEERSVLGGTPLPTEKIQSVLMKAQFALKNYSPGDSVKTVNTFREKWVDSRKGLQSISDPEARIQAAVESDSLLDDLSELSQMYSAVPAVAAAIQQIPVDFSSKVIDDAYIYAYEYHDRISKNAGKKDQRKRGAEMASKYRQEYEELTGETIEQGRRRQLMERSSRAAAKPTQAQPAGLSGLSPQATAGTQEDLLNFSDAMEAVEYFSSPEASKYRGRQLKIVVGGKEIDYSVPAQ